MAAKIFIVFISGTYLAKVLMPDSESLTAKQNAIRKSLQLLVALWGLYILWYR